MQLRAVAPFTGAWIEIYVTKEVTGKILVAPFTGAWIEILVFGHYQTLILVAPFTGAWIEIGGLASAPSKIAGRSLHGGVD